MVFLNHLEVVGTLPKATEEEEGRANLLDYHLPWPVMQQTAQAPVSSGFTGASQTSAGGLFTGWNQLAKMFGVLMIYLLHHLLQHLMWPCRMMSSFKQAVLKRSVKHATCLLQGVWENILHQYLVEPKYNQKK